MSATLLLQPPSSPSGPATTRIPSAVPHPGASFPNVVRARGRHGGPSGRLHACRIACSMPLLLGIRPAPSGSTTMSTLFFLQAPPAVFFQLQACRQPLKLLTDPISLLYSDTSPCACSNSAGDFNRLLPVFFPFPTRQNIIGFLNGYPLSPFQVSLEMLSIDGPTPHRPNGTHFLENRIALSLQFLDRIHRDLLVVDIYLQYNGPESMPICKTHFYVAGLGSPIYS